MALWEKNGLQRTVDFPLGLDFSSNDYLALSQDSRLKQVAIAAIQEFGVGTASSRLLRGHCGAHEEAETEAARWCGAEAALLFPSGWQANLGLLQSLAGAEDVLFSAVGNHASLIEGCRAAQAQVQVFDLANLEGLAAQLQRHASARRRIMVCEHVDSMAGTLAPLQALAQLCEEHDAWMTVDEAHSAGILPFFQHPRLLVRMFTGGKALGIGGGFVCGSQKTVDTILQRGRSFVFTTAIPPATAAALAESIRVAQAEPERGQRALAAAEELRQHLAASGIETDGGSAIVPVLLGSPMHTMDVAQKIRAAGFDVRGIRPPTVPEGTSRLRVVCHADHSPEEIRSLAKAIVGAMAKTKTGFVVCGTDTSVGKTTIAALLLRDAVRQNIQARYLKPVQTGPDSDTQEVLRLTDLPAEAATTPCFQFAAPASVDQAAQQENTHLRAEDLHTQVQQTVAETSDADWILECAGGLRVPLNAEQDQADFLSLLAWPLILVARSTLGTLNHTLLSLEAAQGRGLTVQAVFLVGDPHPDNAASLRARLGSIPLFQVPWFAGDGPTTQDLDAWLEENSLPSWFHAPRLALAGR